MNYQKELDKLVQKLSDDGRVPKLLLHSCCAPVSYTHLDVYKRQVIRGSYEKEKIKLSKKEKTSQEAYPDGTDHQNRHVDI